MQIPTTVIEKTHWHAVYSLFLGVTSLIAAEFIPVSLLTPIAQELNVTEGMAGQSVTVVGIFAVLSSLTLSPLTKTINRRHILLALSTLLVMSNLLIAFSSHYSVFLFGRALLGLCVGGFWSISSAVVLQLAAPKDTTRALSIVYAGVSVATIIALPLASYLGAGSSWRTVFVLASLLSLIALTYQYFTLPPLKSQKSNGFINMFRLLAKNWVLAGMGATLFSYGGYHIFFTYLRPFLEYSLTLATDKLTLVLLAFGIANGLGTFMAGFVLGKAFRITMIAIHLLSIILAILLFINQKQNNYAVSLTILWGFIFGFIPVGWSSWITRTLADQAEMMGSLSVAAIQFSIAIAAAIGGLAFDHLGMHSIFMASALINFIAVILIKYSFHLFFKTTHRLA